ncbi:hypothetical protein D3C80_344490 [compost metagenome]
MAEELAGNSTASNPMNAKRKTALSSTFKLNFPSASVVVPVLDPFTVTETPGSGVPLLSNTDPLTVMSANR